MPLSISTFRDSFNRLGTPAPTNRFEVTITTPGGISIETDVSRDLTLLCEQAELPGKSMMTVEDKLYGPPRKIAYGQLFIDTTMTFICTSNGWEEKMYFDEWQNQIVDPELFDAKYFDEYTTSLILKTFDERNVSNYGIKFIEAYPLNVGAINLGMNQNNEYARLAVTFAYRRWEYINPASGDSINNTTSLGSLRGFFSQ